MLEEKQQIFLFLRNGRCVICLSVNINAGWELRQAGPDPRAWPQPGSWPPLRAPSLPILPQGLSLSPAPLPPGCAHTPPAAAASPPPGHPEDWARSPPAPAALVGHVGHRPAAAAHHGLSPSLRSIPGPRRQILASAPGSPRRAGAEQGVFGSGRLRRSRPFSCCPWNACHSGTPCARPLLASRPGNCL